MDALEQAIHAWLLPLGWTGEAVLRLLVATLLGGTIGLEREVRGRQAGFRTNLLVCLGSALVMLVSMRLASMPWKAVGDASINVDPARIAYGVMTGIGFLGAGAILQQGASVRGLTTAAGLWCVAALGLGVGAGLYTLSVSATVLVLAALWFLNYFERVLPKRHYRRLVIRCPWDELCLQRVAGIAREAGVVLVEEGLRRSEDLRRADLVLSVGFRDFARLDDFLARLRGGGGVELMSVEKL